MEVQKLLKMVSEGLKTLARGFEAIAERVIDSAKDKNAAAPQSKKPSVSLKSFQGESKPTTEAKEPEPGAAEPVEKKAAEPVEKKAAEPVEKKAAEPVEKKAAEPVEKKAAEPVKKKAVLPAKKKVSGPAKKKTAKPVTAMDTVLNIIGSSETGADTATIREKSGYERKKVSNIVYKLKKQGKIASVKKGVYVKS
jgi:outer membrane biosynthesis protein TonB